MFPPFSFLLQPKPMFWLRILTANERNMRYRLEAAAFFSYAEKRKATFFRDFPTSQKKNEYIFGISMMRPTKRYAFRHPTHPHPFPLRGHNDFFDIITISTRMNLESNHSTLTPLPPLEGSEKIMISVIKCGQG